MTRQHRTAALALCALAAAAPASAEPFLDQLVQPPHPQRPERGAVAGSLASTTYGPEALARGGFALPAPLEAPEERGPLLADVFPVYTPGGGVSAWGLGWRTELIIRRSRVTGHLDYTSDGFVSPWGRLAEGDDGAYYPLGLRPRVRLERAGDEGWLAVDARGTRYEFAHRDTTARGTYAWHLTRVAAVTGEQTALRWQAAPFAHPTLEAVTYGAAGVEDAQRLQFHYEPLDVPLVDYHAGERRELAQRVRRVDAEVRRADTGAYALRWSFDLEHATDGWGPAPRLVSVTRRFASGAALPPARYEYGDPVQGAASARLAPVSPALAEALSRLGPGALSPSRIALADVDDDGYVDIEHGRDQATYRQTAGGWEPAPLPPVTDAEPRCRPAASVRNAPRQLAWMLDGAAAPQVISTRVTSAGTQIAVCDRTGGEIYFAGTVAGAWELDARTRLVDVDGDFRADIVRVAAGRVSVLRNASTAERVAFEPLPGRPIGPRLAAETVWLHDVNGDAIADIVARTSSSLVVWHGVGGGAFEPVGSTRWLYAESGRRLSQLSRWGLQFVDVDRDGLVDLALTSGGRVSLLANRGDRFVEVASPRLGDRAVDLSNPVIGDLTGSGNLQLAYTVAGAPEIAQLNATETGLLVTADDGQGNRLAFEYARSPARIGGAPPPIVLASLTAYRGGREPETLVYDYDDPVAHSAGRFLLGFGVVRQVTGLGQTELTLHHDDEVVGVLTSELTADDAAPALLQFATYEHERRAFAGVSWLRPVRERRGVRTYDGEWELAEALEHAAYERELCATLRFESTAHGVARREVLLDEIDALGPLACVARLERVVASHADPSLDVTMERAIQRDAAGRPRMITDRGAGGAVLHRQHVDYDRFGRVTAVRAPTGAVTAFEYDPVTGLLARERAPDGVITAVQQRDPLTGAVLTLAVERGAGPHRSHYRYDPFERLEATWNDLEGTSELPAASWRYRLPAAEGPGAVFEEQLVADGAVRRRVSLTDAGGEALATLVAVEGGWAASRIARHDPALGTTSVFEPRGVLESIDRYDALTADAVLVGRTARAISGDVTHHWQRLPQGVARELVGVRLPGPEAVSVQSREAGHLSSIGRDAAGRIAWAADELGQVIAYRYDALGRLVEVELPDGRRHRRRYDDLGRVAAIERDGVGSVIHDYAETTGLLASKTYRDADGALVRTESHRYDHIGRLTASVYRGADGDEEVVHRRHDEGPGQAGRLTAVVTPDVERTVAFDAAGRVTRTRIAFPGWLALDVKVQPCADGAPCQVTREVRRGDTVIERVEQRYVYGEDGRLARIELQGAPLATMAYGADGRLMAIELPGAHQVAFARDPDTGAVTGYVQSGPAALTAATWRYDERGLIATETYQAGDEIIDRELTYDPARRLRSFADLPVPGGGGPSPDEGRYRYDPDGRLAFAADARGDRALPSPFADARDADPSYRYDRAGRLVGKGALALHYGPRGLLARAEADSGAWRFGYDDSGARVVRARGDAPAYATVAGGILTESGFLEPLELGDLILGVVERGVFRMLPLDRRGTPFADAATGELGLASPYGARAGAGPIDSLFAYTGAPREAALGTVRLGVRDYDPALGGFHTPDPRVFEDPEHCLRSPRECGLYGYAAGDPVRFTDPDGEAVCGGVCVTLAVLWVADKGYAAYEAYQDYQAVAAGETTAEQVVAERAVESAAGAMFGAAGRWAAKGVKRVGSGAAAIAGATPGGRATTRFVAGARVEDLRTGRVFEGTVDLKPTLDRISAGRSYPHRNDGSVFRNKEGLLPRRPEDYYREFVHPTPGIRGPGPQRVLQGQAGELFYTPDHYHTFIPLN